MSSVPPVAALDPATGAGVSPDGRPDVRGLDIAVLAGGLSHERDVSLRSGRRVAQALRLAGAEVTVLDPDATLLPTLRDLEPDLVWPLLHGANGEDGTIRDVLDLIGVRYLGSQPEASRLSWNKPVAKSVVARAGLATPRCVVLPRDAFRELGAGAILDAIVATLGLPLVVKPTQGGSALGMSLVDDAASLPRAMVDCFSYGDHALIERRIEGVEVAVGVLDTPSGPEALPVVEIDAAHGVYDYEARYTAGMTRFFAPARLDADTTARVQRAAVTAHRALGLRDVSRTDLIVDGEGTPWFLEVNVSPGMTETSLLPQALLARGDDLETAYAGIVRTALDRQR